MARLIGWVLAAAFLAVPAAGLAQEAAAGGVERPRVELGAGVGVMFGSDIDPWTLVDTRVGVRLSRHWSVEGLVHFSPPDEWGMEGYYRGQAVWRNNRSVNQFLAGFGVAGWFERWKRPEYRRVWDGNEYVSPAASGFEIDAPMYPTVMIGYERILAPHLAVRAELTVAFAFADGGGAVALMPAASVSVPLGHYKVRW